MTGGNVKEDKITPSDLEAHAQVLIEMGLMPSLEAVLAAVAETREKYKPKIEAARQERNKNVIAVRTRQEKESTIDGV